MMKTASPRNQRGATLVVGLIMLVLLTLLVTSAFTLSTGSLKAVGNMQFRNEAIAAANDAIEQVLSTDFLSDPAIPDVSIDLDGDGQTDYTVSFAPPECVRASVAVFGLSSSVTLPSMTTATHWNTVWELDASVNDSVTGASIRIRHGVRRLLNNAQKTALCV